MFNSLGTVDQICLSQWMKSNQLSVLREKHCPWILQEVHCYEHSQGRPEIDCVSFQKDSIIKTIKTVELVAFILLEAKSS